MDWNDLAQDKEWYIAFESGSGFLALKIVGNFLTSCRNVRFFKKNSPHGVR